ncbi:MAG: CDGSH iron-sulfur domain-containing protein [Bacteroidales bacterium]|nr:CDGSH iron-sulfur domain-containing protein [Bacteroidales bacterium]
MSKRVIIEFEKSGSINISGEYTFVYNGEEQENITPIKICRCQKSKKSPFCDGSHLKYRVPF